MPLVVPNVRIGMKDNSLYPLPPDYASLSKEGQRKARVNGVGQWTFGATETVHSWKWFREYYLGANPEISPVPEGLFYDELLPSPPAHYAWTYDLAHNTYSAWAAPRGGAKSTVIGIENPLMRVLTAQNYRILIVMAKAKGITSVEKRWSVFQTLLTENEAIRNDFGVLKPSRNSGKLWNKAVLEFPNGASLSGVGVDGRSRGERTKMVLFDDPEQDPKSSTDLIERNAHLERWIFKIVIPMGRTGAKVGYICTLEDLRSWGWHLLTTKEDTRLSMWHRKVWNVESSEVSRDPDGGQRKTRVFFWQEMYDDERIAFLKESMGPEHYASELMNNPVSGEALVFQLDPRLHGYEFKGPTPDSVEDPLSLDSEVVWGEPTEGLRSKNSGIKVEEKTKEWRGFVNGLYRIMTIDTAPTVSPDSDYSAIQVFGYDRMDTLWSLDLWVGKKLEDELVKIIWYMAMRWSVRVIAPESIGLQKSLQGRLISDLGAHMREQGKGLHIFPIKSYGRIDKGSRIMAQSWRFHQGRFKMPSHRWNTWPYSELCREITAFTPNMRGIGKDDALDTLAMTAEVVRPGRKGPAPVARGEPNILEKLRRGQVRDSLSGIPYAGAIGVSNVPSSIYWNLRKRQAIRLEYSQKRKRQVNLPKSPTPM